MFQDLVQKDYMYEKDSSQKLSRNWKLQTSCLSRTRQVLVSTCAHLKIYTFHVHLYRRWVWLPWQVLTSDMAKF